MEPVLIGVGVVILVMLLAFALIYNGFVSRRNAVRNAFCVD